MRLHTTVLVVAAALQVSALPPSEDVPPRNLLKREENREHLTRDIADAADGTGIGNHVPEGQDGKSNALLPPQLAAEQPTEAEEKPPTTSDLLGHGPEQHDIHHPETEEVEFPNKVPDDEHSSSNDRLPAHMEEDSADRISQSKGEGVEKKQEDYPEEHIQPIESGPPAAPQQPDETKAMPDELPTSVIMVQDGPVPETTSYPGPKEVEDKEAEDTSASKHFVEGFPTRHSTTTTATGTGVSTTTTTTSFVPDATIPSIYICDDAEGKGTCEHRPIVLKNSTCFDFPYERVKTFNISAPGYSCQLDTCGCENCKSGCHQEIQYGTNVGRNLTRSTAIKRCVGVNEWFASYECYLSDWREAYDYDMREGLK